MRGRVPTSWIAAAALLSVTLGGGAAAESGWAVPGSVYVEMGGGVEWVDLPEQTYPVLMGEATGTTDDEFDLWTAEVAFGYADPDGLRLPDPIGRNARIEGRVRYAHGVSDNETQRGGATFFAVDGTGTFDAFGGTTVSLFNSALETWDADLTYQTDVMVADWLAISPLVGLTYTRMTFENDFKIGFMSPSKIEANDHTRTHYYGGVLGVDFSARPIETLELSLGLRGDLMGASSSMRVRQDRFTPDSRDESDNDTNFAARAAATAGLTWYFGPLALGVEGYARYLSYFATADHPMTSTDRASNIDGEDMWSAGARASLTIWFP